VASVPPVEPTGLGLHAHLGGMIGGSVRMGGLTGALRLRRPSERLALDFGIGAYAGEDFNGLDRTEVPLTVDLLAYLNPRDQLQIYGLAGLGVSFAHAQGASPNGGSFMDRSYAHVGGEVGVGLELRLSRWFALTGDVRAFLRQRVDQDSEPEFTDPEDPNRQTDTSTGALATIGATLYF
jgi:hypothetical protein